MDERLYWIYSEVLHTSIPPIISVAFIHSLSPNTQCDVLVVENSMWQAKKKELDANSFSHQAGGR